MKYKTDSYLLILFDEVGSKIDTKNFESYLQSKDFLNRFINANPDSSGAIMRVLYNSKFKSDKWSTENVR